MHGRSGDPTIVCLVCGTPPGADDRFCGVCGALLPDPPNRAAAQELDLEQLFSHKGRIGQGEFFLTASALSLLLLLALGLLAAMLGNVLGVALGVLLTGAAAVALACASIKRLHDTNTTGWPAAIAPIPVLGWLFILVLALIGPSRGQNPFGLPNDGSIRARTVMTSA